MQPGKTPQPGVPHFLQGGGEMGALTREFDWSLNILGKPEAWPQSLKTTVSILLKSRLPMFLWWGPELIQFYNDAYRPSLGKDGKHPLALGQRGEDCWPEIWPVIKPLIDQVLLNGEATWADDQLIPIYRNGRLEDVYWTFGYSPVEDDFGERYGILVTCIETTENVTNLKRLKETLLALQVSENNLSDLITQAPVAIGYLKGRELIITAANKKILEVWGKDSGVIGRPLRFALPEIESQPFLKLLDDVYTTGIAFFGHDYKALLEHEGVLQELFFDFVYQPLKDGYGETTGIIVVANNVTESVNARKKIEESEDRLRQVVMKSPFIMLVLKGSEFVVSIANQALYNYWNKTETEALGKPLLTVLPELEGQPFPAILKRVYDSGEPYGEDEVLNYFESEDGIVEKYVSYLYEPIMEADGRVSHILVAAEDRTKMVQDRKRILTAEENLRLSLQAAELGTFDMDLKKGTLYWDKRCRELFGISHQETVTYDTDFVMNLHPDDRDRVTKLIDNLFDKSISDGDYDVEYRTVGVETGIIRWLRAKGKVLFNEQDEPYRFIGSVLDITTAKNYQYELQQINEELAASNEELYAAQQNLQGVIGELNSSENRLRGQQQRLESFFMMAPAGICVLGGPNLVFELINPRYQQLLPGRDLLNRPIFEAMPELIEQPLHDVLLNVYKTGETFEANELLISISAYEGGPTHERYFNFNYLARRDETGQVDGILAFVFEVTAIVIAKKEIEAAEKRFRLIADNISQLAWMADSTGALFWYNQRWFDYTGTTLDEVKGWGWERVHDPEHLDRVAKKFSKHLKSGEVWEDTFPIRGADGNYRWFLSRAIPTKNEQGEVISWFGTNTDITEQRQDDQRKNDFIGMVSHELKTPLTSLTAIVQLANSKLKTSPDTFLAGAMDRASQQVKKMSGMINGFLNISRLESGKILISKADFDLDELVGEMIQEAELTLTSHTIYYERCGPLIINADRDKIGSVISNLLSNAIKYSPKGKRIDVKCELTGNNVQLSIKDEGIGIKPKDKERLFERYYRVESNYTQHISGFGIGLYLSYEIIQRHGGKIWAESEGGEGSTFYFSLPLK
jgi:PAS domain S-box-containing protein